MSAFPGTSLRARNELPVVVQSVCYFFRRPLHPFARFLSRSDEQTRARIRAFRRIVPGHRHKRINYAIEADPRYYLPESVDMRNGNNAFVMAGWPILNSSLLSAPLLTIPLSASRSRTLRRIDDAIRPLALKLRFLIRAEAVYLRCRGNKTEATPQVRCTRIPEQGSVRGREKHVDPSVYDSASPGSRLEEAAEVQGRIRIAGWQLHAHQLQLPERKRSILFPLSLVRVAN